MIEFRAGKMTLQERQLVSDSRKGKVKITKVSQIFTPLIEILLLFQDGDGLIHFQWITETGLTEDEIVLLPDQATFSKV